jgi:hypothetical protein
VFGDSTEEQRGRVIAQSHPHGVSVPASQEIEITIGQGPASGDVERSSFIEFDMPLNTNVSGMFEFVLYRNGIPYGEPLRQNVSLRRNVRFEFSDIGNDVEYVVEIRNPATGLSGFFVRYRIDFTQDTPFKYREWTNEFILEEILPPPATVATTQPTTAATEPTTEPTTVLTNPQDEQ